MMSDMRARAAARLALLSGVAWLAGACEPAKEGAAQLPRVALAGPVAREAPASGPAPAELEGKWHPAPEESRAQEALALEALGYLPGYEPAADRRGVTVHQAALASAGLNLYSSGHAPEAFLMGMDGLVLHRWRLAFSEAFPDYPPEALRDSHQWWRHVHLLEDGGLLAIHEGLGLVRLDVDSHLRWALAGGFHHDVDVAEDGTIYALIREPALLRPGRRGLVDSIAVLDSRGRLQRKISLLEAFERSRFAPMLRDRLGRRFDPLHTNTLTLLDDEHSYQHPAFARGNALVSMRHLDTIAVVNLARGSVEWALTGQWSRQHHPSLLRSGTLLLFDNQGSRAGARVLEIDPLTQALVWSYEGNAQNGFRSLTLGFAQRLPNGNTLITESEAGRAFEVTREGRIVWEFYNPERAGESGELIATLFEMVRLPRESIDWLD